MASLCLSSSRIVSLHHQKPFLSLQLRPRPSALSGLGHATSSLCFNPLRSSADRRRTATVLTKVEKRRKRGSSVVCYAAPMLSVHNLQWISTISCVGEYGIWAAFLALLTRLFFSFPGELELPFIALLLVIVAPYQVMSIRGKQEGAILSLAISCFLAFQHFSRAGSLQKAFDQNSVIATVAIIGVAVVSFLFLI
ncbi:cold-regulated 413 inner membrane protein 2, chloroplastic isoform X2 [Capsella rubella]|uniref:cold-regulated 413 inner membrane protein 2, chloroplastic isoform X2 n=1 Tax=Capsella rubella TaxID=81985 RepID=UPI000CD4B16E|nr:cold-regulated 413 inner membrane protein 2, chloroplastic isoform X2 [Capsella rubella]